jgi:hypothetical protein
MRPFNTYNLRNNQAEYRYIFFEKNINGQSLSSGFSLKIVLSKRKKKSGLPYLRNAVLASGFGPSQSRMCRVADPLYGPVDRVTKCFNKKIAQNVAQTRYCRIIQRTKI